MASNHRFLFYNASIFTNQKTIFGFLVVENGKISKIGERLPSEQLMQSFSREESLDCEKNLILPGFIDSHVHFRDLEQKHKETVESGSKSALSGGVTTVLAMPNTSPPLSTPKNLQTYFSLSESLYCNIGLFCSIKSDFSLDLLPKLNELGIFGIKIYPGDSSLKFPLNWDVKELEFDTCDPESQDKSLILRKKINLYSNWHKLFNAAKKLDLPVLFHPELPRSYEEIRNSYDAAYILAESQRYTNPNLFAHFASHPIKNNECGLVQFLGSLVPNLFPDAKDAPHIHICHVSSREVIQIAEKMLKSKSYPLSFEVTPHHIFLNYNLLFQKQSFGKVLTPLRSPITQKELFSSVQNGEIDTIATDHAPHTLLEKSQDFFTSPSGFPGVDVAALLLLNEVFNFRLALDKVVQYYSTNPARLFGIKNKGLITEGYDADLILVKKVDPYSLDSQNSYGKSKWSPYDGRKVIVKIDKVFIAGSLAFDSEKEIIIPLGQMIHKTLSID